jgi:hypothetical protein
MDGKKGSPVGGVLYVGYAHTELPLGYARAEPPPCVCGHVWRNHAPWGCWSCANHNRECERYEGEGN